MKTIITQASILLGTAPYQVIANGSIAFDQNGTITYIGENLSEDQLSTYEEVICMSGKWILPGLVNTHGHAAMSLLRGYADDLPLKEWLEQKIWPIEERYDDEHVYWGAKLAVAEMIRSGTTCFLDMYDRMHLVAQVVEETGMRASLCRGVIGLGEEKVVKGKIQEMADFAYTFRGAAGGRISTMVSPHALYTCPPEVIESIVGIAREGNFPIHTHLSETRFEVEYALRQFDARPVEHMRRLGVFQQPTLVAHGVHLSPEEVEILCEHGVRISHNPASNLKLASGVAPVPFYLQKGLVVSLGTDSASSNNNLDLFEEMRLAALLHKGTEEDPLALPAEEAFAMATYCGAISLALDKQTGSLEVGKEADFIALDPRAPHLTPQHNMLSHLVYAAKGADVTDLFVKGVQLMKNRQLLTIDEEELYFQVKKLTQKPPFA